MTPRSLALRLSFAAAVVAGCYTGSATDLARAPDPTEPEPVQSVDAGKSKPNGKPKPQTPAATGLPCDVAAVLESACGSCHGATPSGGARNRLVSYEDLAAKVEGDPSQTNAQAALRRMQSSSRPMPPSGQLAAESIAIVARWVREGLPRGTCETPEPQPPPDRPPPDDGHGDGTEDAGAPPPTSVCTSGVTADEFPDVLEWMNPGRACIACHTSHGMKGVTAGGTVYPTLHEPDLCNGIGEGLNVLIIDKDGNAHTFPTNAAGNFVSFESFPVPYRAMVVRGRQMRMMQTPQTDTDCNGCHTEWGLGAPGRILAP